jgi:uncharacterized protein YcbX
MAAVASLHLYPVKSCAGLTLQSAVLGPAGLESDGVGDREWMVVTAADGEFLTQRQAPRMALILPAIEADALVLRAPGMPEARIARAGVASGGAMRDVRLWNHSCRAFDEGDAAAAWLSDFLGRTVRLARFDPSHQRASSREWTGDIEALNRFSDGYPLLMISAASLADLNLRLREAGREPLPMNRFRPNIVLTGVDAFDEDRFASLSSGAMVLRPVKPCPRCPIPSVDQRTGVVGPDPLDVLSRYRDDQRHGVVFGQNVIVAAGIGSVIAAGQSLDTEWNF